MTPWSRAFLQAPLPVRVALAMARKVAPCVIATGVSWLGLNEDALVDIPWEEDNILSKTVEISGAAGDGANDGIAGDETAEIAADPKFVV